MTDYDYSMYPEESFSYVNEMNYWGLHEVNGRIEVDVKRYEQACGTLFREFLPDKLKGRDGLYIPSKKHRYDYTSNYIKDCLDSLNKDWEYEYKPLFKSITTPEQVREKSRLNAIMFESDMDCIDEIDVDAALDGFRRIESYNRIIRELYCVFIMKVCAEIDRIILKSISDKRYEEIDYSIHDFIVWCNGKNHSVGVQSLRKWDQFRKIHDVNNFLKHSSIRSYEALKKFHPECLIEYEEEYENGEFPYDWINLKETDIDQFLSDMRIFCEEFCEKILGENLQMSYWDHDDYFRHAYHELRDPWTYLGV